MGGAQSTTTYSLQVNINSALLQKQKTYGTFKIKDGEVTRYNFAALDKEASESIPHFMARYIFETENIPRLEAAGYSREGDLYCYETPFKDGRQFFHQVAYSRTVGEGPGIFKSIFCCKPDIEPYTTVDGKEYIYGYELKDRVSAQNRHSVSERWLNTT